MNKIIKRILYILLIIHNSCLAKTNSIININNVRIWPAPDNIRIVFDISNPVKYKIYTLKSHDGYKIVVDFNNAKLNSKLITDLNKAPKLAKINRIRTEVKERVTKVIFELDQQLVFNNFTLKPNERYGHRLIIDLEHNEKQEILALFDLNSNNSNINNNINSESKKQNNTIKINKYIIAIDAGHGGEDPGAIGWYGTEEKQVVLDIAKKLQNYLNNQPDKTAFLIRKGDYYISLTERMLLARKHKADLLLSIHADAFSNPKSDGGSVFVLSEKGASSAAARWLAASERKSDILGGVQINHNYKSDGLASVLLDLSQTANHHASFAAAKSILFSMQHAMPLHKSTVEMANFAILKSPDVPSVLIEAGFISNPRTEIKLKDQAYQHKVAKSILKGIDQYFSTKPKNL